MQDSPAAPEVRVCAATDLVNGGLGVKVPVSDGAGRTTGPRPRYPRPRRRSGKLTAAHTCQSSA